MLGTSRETRHGSCFRSPAGCPGVAPAKMVSGEGSVEENNQVMILFPLYISCVLFWLYRLFLPERSVVVFQLL